MVTAPPSTVPRRECTLMRYTVSDCSSEKQWLLLPASTISSLVCLSKHKRSERNKWHKTNCLFSKFSKKEIFMILYDASFQSWYLWGPGWLCDNHWLLVRASRTHIYWSGQTVPHSRCSPAGWLVVQRNTQEIMFKTQLAVQSIYLVSTHVILKILCMCVCVWLTGFPLGWGTAALSAAVLSSHQHTVTSVWLQILQQDPPLPAWQWHLFKITNMIITPHL